MGQFDELLGWENLGQIQGYSTAPQPPALLEWKRKNSPSCYNTASSEVWCGDPPGTGTSFKNAKLISRRKWTWLAAGAASPLSKLNSICKFFEMNLNSKAPKWNKNNELEHDWYTHLNCGRLNNSKSSGIYLGKGFPSCRSWAWESSHKNVIVIGAKF